MNPEECKIRRKELGLSQQVLAGKIGSYQMAISRYEAEGFVRKGDLIERLEIFFGDSIQEKPYESAASFRVHDPTKEEASKFQIKDEVIRPDNEVSVGTLIRIERNYLLVSKDTMSGPQFYHPGYFKPKKRK
ncbi:helix-turn-helix transcriptional regulator [Candidatus Pacearchaeota archaeon]|nr:helix-turn-helix transcriptional regulator [Candidatus Pacearchaeota archaeon]